VPQMFNFKYMINKIIYSILFVFLINDLNAQHSFEKIISTQEDQVINDVLEDDDGNFLLVGRIHNIESNLVEGYLLMVDSSGNLIEEKVIQPTDTNAYIFFNVHFYDNNYYLLGSSTGPLSHDKKNLWYMKLSKDLDILSQNELELPTGKWFSYFNSIIDSDTNFVIAGYTSRNDSIQIIHSDPAFIKISIDGDSICSNFMTEPPQRSRLAFDIIENYNHTDYYAFVSRFTNSSIGQKLVLNKNLDSINLQPIPLGIFDNYSPVYLTDSTILLSGLGSPYQSVPYALNVISINDQTELIDYNYFKLSDNFREYPAMYNGVSKNGGNIFIGGTSNFDFYNPFFSTLNSWFHLIKINPDISPIWEYWYGGDVYYHLYSILATNDGGCLMVGNRYDDETQVLERDIYIAKVNTDGLIVWTQEILINKQETTVYPNPGTNQLIIKTSGNLMDFELKNITGQLIINKRIENNYKTINTESLRSGIYLYRIIDKKNKTIETGKWIKK